MALPPSMTLALDRQGSLVSSCRRIWTRSPAMASMVVDLGLVEFWRLPAMASDVASLSHKGRGRDVMNAWNGKRDIVAGSELWSSMVALVLGSPKMTEGVMRKIRNDRGGRRWLEWMHEYDEEEGGCVLEPLGFSVAFRLRRLGRSWLREVISSSCSRCHKLPLLFGDGGCWAREWL